jgi:hypothetical protein
MSSLNGQLTISNDTVHGTTVLDVIREYRKHGDAELLKDHPVMIEAMSFVEKTIRKAYNLDYSGTLHLLLRESRLILHILTETLTRFDLGSAGEELALLNITIDYFRTRPSRYDTGMTPTTKAELADKWAINRERTITAVERAKEKGSLVNIQFLKETDPGKTRARLYSRDVGSWNEAESSIRTDLERTYMGTSRTVPTGGDLDTLVVCALT